MASFQSAGATLVPRAVAEFHERHPKVDLSMIEAETDPARECLTCGDIDLALLYDFERAPGGFEGDLALTHLIDDPYDVLLPAGHRLAKKRSLSIADLEEEPWVASTTDSGCREITRRACQDHGFEPRVAFECDETLAAQALVAAGVGVTILPRLALTTIHPDVVVRKLARNSQVIRRVWAAREEGAYHSPASEAMVQILLDVAQDFRTASLEAA
jgi:DNA-binding transcriptional LysR family regulator